MKASAVIPTRNRIDELRSLLQSTRTQTVPVEVLVMDDGTSDTTEGMVRNEFPEVRYFHLGRERGPAFQRNRGIELASNNIVFPIDDDVRFPSHSTFEETVAEFDHPRVGAVAIPFVNVRSDQAVRQVAPTSTAIHVAHAFVGAAHAVRRDLFLKLGGYREHFFYMGEEGDYCLRMLNAGFIVRLGRADAVEHLESPNRNTPWADRLGRRNDILFAWHNVPAARLPFHLTMTVINGIRTGFASGNAGGMLRGTFDGFSEIVFERRERVPVSQKIYELHRRLKKSGPLRLDEIESELPPISVGPAEAAVVS